MYMRVIYQIGFLLLVYQYDDECPTFSQCQSACLLSVILSLCSKFIFSQILVDSLWHKTLFRSFSFSF